MRQWGNDAMTLAAGNRLGSYEIVATIGRRRHG